MKVIWKSDICLESGRQKLTLEVPPEYEDEFFMVKKAARSGKDIQLVLGETVEPPDDAKPLLSMILDFAEKKYQQGKEDGLKSITPTVSQGVLPK